MWFWIWMLLNDLIIPAIMIVFGRIFIWRTPADIGSLFGYRTSMSMKNQDTWQFAHRYCGKLWYRCGWITLLVTVLAMLVFIRRDMDIIAAAGGIICLLQTIPCLLSIYFTEKALKQQFDPDGERRES